MNKLPISAIILTYNADINIEHCLKSVCDWIGEIIIVDSFSTDNTLEICQKYTNKIFQHPFENPGKQFNWALDNIPTKYNWIMRLDHDEFVAEELAKEICQLFLNLPSDVGGIYLKRRVYFMGHWIRHGGIYPRWFLRIFRKDKGRYEELMDDHFVLYEGKTINLKSDFINYDRKNLNFWLNRHIKWSDLEMHTLLNWRQINKASLTIKPCLFSTQEKRIRWFKYIYTHLPLFLRAFLYFFYRYFVKFGFLDGVEGLIFHFLQGFWYRFLVDAKIYEFRKTKKQQNIGT